ncbi:hypothetical protein FCULG_00007925 [Fusarium culmorum]|uniref:Uncharacterized protein n=1 Tax=Fusarium culmorum TaxID=5516 RepID=A0A2T4H4G4_FUSCU|nr:hypothetical protein FCULG_00007925 [Fusarium culmorum]
MATEVPQNELTPGIVNDNFARNKNTAKQTPQKRNYYLPNLVWKRRMTITSNSHYHPLPMVQLSPSVAGKSRFKWANDGIHGSPLRSESANEVTSSATLEGSPLFRGFYSAVTAGGNGGWLCFCDGTGEADTQDVTVHRHILPHIGLSPPFLMHIKGEGPQPRPTSLFFTKSAGGPKTVSSLGVSTKQRPVIATSAPHSPHLSSEPLAEKNLILKKA